MECNLYVIIVTDKIEIYLMYFLLIFNHEKIMQKKIIISISLSLLILLGGCDNNIGGSGVSNTTNLSSIGESENIESSLSIKLESSGVASVLEITDASANQSKELQGVSNNSILSNQSSTQISQPNGSYIATCKNIEWSNGSLSAECKNTADIYISRTSLDYVGTCAVGSSVSNYHGHLVCDTLAPSIPTGSYQNSCTDIKWSSNTLVATCRNTINEQKSSYLNYGSCNSGSTVSNYHGHLVCDSVNSNTPSGSYKASCEYIQWDGKLLGASCKNTVGKHLDSSLDYAGTCATGSGVHNFHGHLMCDILNNAVPNGSYQNSCTDIGWDGVTVSANCRTTTNQIISSTLNYATCQSGSTLSNEHGHLICDQLSPNIPQGSYQGSCKQINWNGISLSAECKNTTGEYLSTSLSTLSCTTGGTVSNNHGHLECDQLSSNLPQGSYLQSCKYISFNGENLSATCSNTVGYPIKSTLGIGACDDGSTISNVHGHLSCDKLSSLVPQGSYLQSCKYISLSGQTLSATCSNTIGEPIKSTLGLGACDSGSTVSNEHGHLVCDRMSSTLPQGSYLQSCKYINYWDGINLMATCDNTAKQPIVTGFDYKDTCAAGSTVSNYHGHLTCDNLSSTVPKGSYLQSCFVFSNGGGRITALCKKSEGVIIGSSIAGGVLAAINVASFFIPGTQEIDAVEGAAEGGAIAGKEAASLADEGFVVIDNEADADGMELGSSVYSDDEVAAERLDVSKKGLQEVVDDNLLELNIDGKLSDVSKDSQQFTTLNKQKEFFGISSKGRFTEEQNSAFNKFNRAFTNIKTFPLQRINPTPEELKQFIMLCEETLSDLEKFPSKADNSSDFIRAYKIQSLYLLQQVIDTMPDSTLAGTSKYFYVGAANTTFLSVMAGIGGANMFDQYSVSTLDYSKSCQLNSTLTNKNGTLVCDIPAI